MSHDWDTFLEWEAEAEQEIKQLQKLLISEPDNNEAKERIAKIKAFFRPHSSDPIFQ